MRLKKIQVINCEMKYLYLKDGIAVWNVELCRKLNSHV